MMQINNPLQMNDWDIKSFFLLIFAIQISLLCLILLDSINIQIPIVRQIFSFLSLTFIPGVLILRILKLHNLGNAKTLLYSVGLSIASLMLIGLFMNTIYPIIGISKPISLFYLIITINLFIFLLCILCYVRDKDFSNENTLLITELLSPSTLFLCLIPFLSIFGTFLLNQYGNNTIQMLLLLVIAILPLISLIWINKKFYPLVIFILSISLLLHTTLISPYIWGADINLELTLAKYVVINSLWYPSINFDYNAMLSIVLLGPIYSIISNLSLIWCFKIIYPTLFSLVPVALYVVYNKVSNEKIAFLACIFFINVNAFYTTLPAVSRQMIAGIFLALILLILIDEKINNHSKSILLVLFGFSLVVSHYGVAYVFLLIIGASILVLLFLKRFKTKLGIKIEYTNYNILNFAFPLFFLCLTLAWFIYVSNYSIFQNGTILGYEIINSIQDILNPETSQGYYYLTGGMSYYQSAERFLYLFGDVLIALGIFGLLFDEKINPEFKVFSITSFLLLVIAIIFPFFAAAMNTDRIFNISLFFLSVFFVTGFLTAVRGLNKIFKKILKSRSFKISIKNALYILTLFLIIFSIFNSAFVYEIFDQPKMGRFALDNNRDFYEVNKIEVTGIEWLKRYYDPQTKIYGDIYKFLILLSLIYSDNTQPLNYYLSLGLPYTNIYTLEYQTSFPYDYIINSTEILGNSYVFFGKYNINKQQFLVANVKNELYYLNNTNLENKIFKLYDNGDVWILKGSG